MSRSATKALNNKYYQARRAAAESNEKLFSREGASELLGIDPNTLAKYELGSLRVPHDTILLMVDLYNEPGLINYYCTNECPVGKINYQKLDEKDITLVTLQMLNNFKDIEKTKETLIEITADGIITDTEKEQLDSVLDYLTKIKKDISELELWTKKHI